MADSAGMRLRWSSPTVITFLVTNLIILLAGCGATTNSATGRRFPPPPPPTAVEVVVPTVPTVSDGGLAEPEGDIPELLGFVDAEDLQNANGAATDDQPRVPTVTVLEPGVNTDSFTVTSGVEPGEIPLHRVPAPSDTTLRIGVTDVDLQTVIPSQATSPGERVTADIFHDGLTSTIPSAVSPEPIVIGELADRWGTLGDSSHWEFVLRPRSFADGTAVTSDAVRLSLSAVVANNPQGPAAQLISSIAGWQAVADGSAALLSGIEIEDDLTLRIRLDSGEPWFDVVLADPRLGIIDPTDPSNGSSLWHQHSLSPGRMTLEISDYDGLEFDRLDIVSYDDQEMLADAYAVGALDLALVGDEADARLLSKSDIAPIQSRDDATFDLLSVTRDDG